MMPEARTPVATAPAATTTEVPVEAESGRHTNAAFWAATGVGIAAIGAGVGLGVLALEKEDAYNKKATETRRKDGERIALLADVSYGIAGAAAVTALVIYFTSGSKKTEEAPMQQAWRVSPSFGRDGAGLAARTEF
jgi:hypothetical protein